MKQEFPIRDEWLPYELHPEFPLQGVALNRRFPQSQIDEMYAHLRKRGEGLGIRFGKVVHSSNTRMALQMAELARDRGLFGPVHEALLKAFFTDVRDIGSLEVLLDVGAGQGMDADELRLALEQGRYLDRLEMTAKEARERGVRAAPTFVFEDGRMLVGAQPLGQFREMFREILH